MVFADLSGFTAMSERLSRLGRIGAEEITDAISACFTSLLSVAYGMGGTLLKFGGDAMLLCFDGDGHAARAVWAAAAMRERLRDVGQRRTSAGNVTLRMSVGIHSGTFDCFVVGAPNRELIIVGSAASRVIEMEQSARAGQIVLSPTAAAALPARCARPDAEDRFLLRCAPPEPRRPRAAPAIDLNEIDLREFVPTAVQESARAGGSAPEHRVVTVAFVHFGGLNRRLSEEKPTDVAADLDQLVTTVADACAANDVAMLATDIDFDGGKFLLSAGAPVARGHEEERMLAATLRIVNADTAFPIRVGLNRGPVFAGDVGPYYRRTYTVMGDTVNVAARLMSSAGVGRVVAATSVIERARGFHFSPPAPLHVKGKRAPIQAAELVGLHGAAPATEASIELPFVGRDAELDGLHARIELARAGQGNAVRIVGAAGIGKSRLVAEMCAHAPEMRTLVVTCEAYETATPYATASRLLADALELPLPASSPEVHRTLRRAVQRHAPELLPWLPLLGSIFDVDIPDTPETAALAPQHIPARVAATTARLIAAVLGRDAIIVIDDADRIDVASREVIEALATAVAEAAVLLICVGRDNLPTTSQEISLEKLHPQAAESAPRAATRDAPLRPHVLAALLERADGNPLFLTELWRAVLEGDDLSALPDSIEALVTAQLDRLTPMHRMVLGYASVIGTRFTTSEFAAIASDLRVDATTWAHLVDFVAISDDGNAEFRLVLIRDTAYSMLPFRRRRELHLRVANAIEARLGDASEREAELLSLHYLRADAYEETWHYARIAGGRASARFAFVDAVALLGRALAAARRLPALAASEVAVVHEELGDANDRIGQYESARSQYRCARKLIPDDPVRQAELLLKEAWIPERIGRYADAIRAIRKGLRAIEGHTSDRARRACAQLSAWYAAVRQGQGRHREAIIWCERALADAHAAGDLDAEAHALYVLDWAYTELGELDHANHLPRAAELYETLGDWTGRGLVLNGQGVIAQVRGDWTEAISCYDQAREAYMRAGSVVDAARAAANIGEVLSDQGRLPEAEALFVDALQVSVAAGYTYDIGLINGFLGRNAARAAQFEDAFGHLETARTVFCRTGCAGDVAKIDAWHAEALFLADDVSAALATADAALIAATADGGISPEIPLLQRVRGGVALAPR